MITKISIENIKGFGSPAYEMDIQLFPGKPNIVVAPNGFGKSTICRAFDCLSDEGIVLEDTDLHNNQKFLVPSLKVVYEGHEYVTDNNRNEVYSHFQCFCINSPLKATSVTKRITGYRHGRAFNNTKDYLDIEPVVLLKTTPVDVSLDYSSGEYKNDFKGNGKLLPNINDDLFRITRFPYNEFDAFSGIRKSNKVQNVVNYLNSLPGTAESISATIDVAIFADLQSVEEYQTIQQFITQTFGVKEPLGVFLRFWILNKLYLADKKHFKQSVDRNRFNSFLHHLNVSIHALDTTWQGIQAVEDKRKVIVNFPKAGTISYGQRDSLYLFSSLEKIKAEIDYTKPVIVIVDELFDYLDMVNMTIIQYFFSEFINQCKKKVEIYPIILTHLSPEYYHNYTFARMNVQYLGDNSGIVNTPTKLLLKARGKDENSSILYGDVSKYLLHYHKDTINREDDFLAFQLRRKWGSGYGFYEYLVEECNKYLSNQPYDYYAIATAVRVRVEKLVYDSLQTDEDKEAFLNTNGTKKKFLEAENKGVDIPDIYSLLGIIYNDTEHLPQNNDSDKAIIYRLNNPMIKHMIHRLFDMETPITIDFLK